MMQHRITFTILCLIIGLIACAPKTDSQKPEINEEVPSPPPPSSITALKGTRWLLTEINGKLLADYPAQNKEPFIMLNAASDNFTGTGGCNSMGGKYELMDNNMIRFGEAMSTKMACPDMTLESDFHAGLELANKYAVEGDRLTLTHTDTTLTMRFQSAPQ